MLTPVLIDTTAVGTIGKVCTRIGRTVSVIGADGTLWAWGGNKNMLAGVGVTSPGVASPSRVIKSDYAGKKVAACDSTENYAALVTTDGTLYTWGDCVGAVSCGYEIGSSLATPNLSVFNGSDIDSIGLGKSNMIVLSRDTVYTIGDNTYGQIGTGAKSEYSTVTWTPISRSGVLAGLSFKSVFSKGYVSGVITNTGELYMWGANVGGVLGGKYIYSTYM
jgi:alpha-tubulin suppressor-like RCC1 family protein